MRPEPVACRLCRLVEQLNISIEMAAPNQHKPFRLIGTLIGRDCQIRHGQMVAYSNNHQHGSWRDKTDVGSGLIAETVFNRAQRNLIAPRRCPRGCCRSKPFIGIRSREGRWRHRVFGHDGQHPRRTRCGAGIPIGVQARLKRCEKVRSNKPTEVFATTYQWHLRHDALHTPVCCSDNQYHALRCSSTPRCRSAAGPIAQDYGQK